MSHSVSRNAATMLSVAGWLVPPDRDEIAVSMCRQPASTALNWHISASPAVAWECTWMGTPTERTSARTRVSLERGVSRPAMSLMAMLWHPISSSSRAIATNCSMLCTGLVV